MSELLLPLVRAVHLAAAFQLFGCLLFEAAVARQALPRYRAAAAALLAPRYRRLAMASAILAVATAPPWLMLVASSMSGGIIAADAATLSRLLATEFGRVLLLHLVLLLVSTLCLALRGTGSMKLVATIAAGLAVLVLGCAGHAAALTGWQRPALMLSQALHLLGAAAWLGALLPLFLLLRACGGTPPSLAAARRFSAIGIAAVTLILVSALANFFALVGDLPGLFGTNYGRWVLVKTALLAGLLLLAATNRFRFTPALAGADATRAAQRLGRSVTAEILLGILLVIAAALLAATPPAAHEQPWWPFSFRFSLGLLAVPELRPEILGDIAFCAGAFLLILLGASWRRLRLVIPLALIALFWRGLMLASLLSVAAVPTSFYQSPTGFTAASVAAGARLFAERCTGCHGPDARGGPLFTPGLSESPADLTALHVYDHAEGELFWWIGNGIAGTPMPAFGDVFDDAARWSLVDFIHANADASRLLLRVAGAPPRPPPAPSFVAECPGTGEVSLSELRGRLVLLLFVGEGAAARLDNVIAAVVGEPDVMVILAPLGEAAPASTFCTSLDPELAPAYAIYRAKEPAKLAGVGFLIDAGGALREGVPFLGLLKPADLKAEFDKLRRTPSTVARGPVPHQH
jgi:putative copper export protein/mono/diheme cytochrome c family protein